MRRRRRDYSRCVGTEKERDEQNSTLDTPCYIYAIAFSRILVPPPWFIPSTIPLLNVGPSLFLAIR
jgi:hypothetical protein